MNPQQCLIHSSSTVGFSPGSSDFNSGCSVFSVTFPKMAYVEIEEIRFKNYYTAYLSILVRKRGSEKSSSGKDEKEWKKCLKSKQLMPFPHCEQSSEDYFLLKSSDFLFPLRNVLEMLFVLSQPSPVWKEFKIEELQLFKAGGATTSKETSLPAWLWDLGGVKDEDGDRQLKGVRSVVDLSKQIHQLWALTEQAHTSQTTTSLGRYDVDGCYDINLLSYN